MTRSIAVNRLSQELAMHRVVDKALVTRAALLTGLSLPEVTAAGDAIRDTQETIERLFGLLNGLRRALVAPGAQRKTPNLGPQDG